MSKYIIEIPDDVQYVLLNGQTDNKCYTAVRPVAELEVLNSDYINENFGELQDEAYQKGINDGSLDVKQRVEGAYQRGLEDAWEAARKIIRMPDGDILDLFPDCYASVCTAVQAILKYDASEAIAKLKVYEDGKHSDRIEVGDIVDVYGHLGVVTYTHENEFNVMMYDGSVGYWKQEDLKKTGKHYDIQSILEAMRTHD